MIKEAIVVRNTDTKQEIFRHELEPNDKPWEVLKLLAQNSMDNTPANKRQYEMIVLEPTN